MDVFGNDFKCREKVYYEVLWFMNRNGCLNFTDLHFHRCLADVNVIILDSLSPMVLYNSILFRKIKITPTWFQFIWHFHCHQTMCLICNKLPIRKNDLISLQIKLATPNFLLCDKNLKLCRLRCSALWCRTNLLRRHKKTT